MHAMAISEFKGSKCPICDRSTDAKYRPFCSKRCADVDLARWLSGSYAIPDDEDEDGGDTTVWPEPEAIPQRKS
jgi:uncharacterized protein